MTEPKLARCPECGRPFMKGDAIACPHCSGTVDDQFRLVKDYLRLVRSADAATISRATGVSMKTIMRFFRSGRLDSVH